MARVAVVVGGTGIIGSALVERLAMVDSGGWKVYVVARRPRPVWTEPHVEYIQCDLLDRVLTVSKLSALTDATHLFWATWIQRSTEALNCADNGKMFQNALDALLPRAKNLQHICLTTGAKHYFGTPEFLRSTDYKVVHDTPFTENMARLPIINFYYTLEDIMFDVITQQKGRLTWSVHRPGAVMGYAPGSFMNILCTLAVYGTICKYEGLSFEFPGSKHGWETLRDASDADLIAEQQIWSATEAKGKNQAFNVTNGDLFRWKKMWPVLAQKLGVEATPFTETSASLTERMQGKSHVWDKIVEEHSLHPTKLEEIAQWWFADVVLNNNVDMILSTNKSKELGFLAFRNSERSALSCIDKMVQRKLIPCV